MHPCPFCHAEALTIEETAMRTRRVLLERVETIPPAWDYRVHEESDNKEQLFRVTCDACHKIFLFNDERYATHWPSPPGEQPCDHDSSLSGCAEGCEACAWITAHGADTWDGHGDDPPGKLPTDFAAVMDRFFQLP